MHGHPAELSTAPAGKAALHRKRAALPLPEKVRLVMELQRIVHPLIAPAAIEPSVVGAPVRLGAARSEGAVATSP